VQKHVQTNKEVNKKGKVLIINAVKEVRQDKNIAQWILNTHWLKGVLVMYVFEI
jgi:hypothetical protein